MSWFKSIFGLFGEKVVYRTGSQFNPVLEVVEDGGHLQLDTGHVNYSFGELHKSFQELFRKMDIAEVDPKSVLILGFGAGSVASILQNELNLDCKITGVEIDPEIIDLGRRFFGTDSSSRLTIVEENAFFFMKKNRDKSDLVVVDLYLDMEVPAQAEIQDFLLKLKDALTPDGYLVFNKYVYDDSTRKSAVRLMDTLAQIFGNVKTYKTGHHQMNNMFVCKKST